MVVSLFKNYKKNVRYAFMIAGIVYLAVILFAIALVRSVLLICGDNVKIMFEQIVEILNGYISTFSIGSITDLPTLGSQIWRVIREGTAGFGGQIAGATLGLTFLLLLAFSIAKSFAMYYMRREGRKTGFVKAMVSVLVRTAVSTAFLTLFVWLASVWLYSAILLLVIWLLTKAIKNMVDVKLAGQTDLKLRELFRFRNLVPVQLAYLMNFVFTIFVGFLLTCVMHVLIALLILLPFAIYFSACVEANSLEIIGK